MIEMPEIKSRGEKFYIVRRKIKAVGNSICFYLCRVFPIDKKLISVCTFEGKGGFGCNPKYIVQELHRRNSEYKFVWFVNDMGKEFPEYIKKVPNTLWSRAYWLTRSNIWIDNYRKPYGTVKRKGQYYLNTNHYTIGIKCTGLWRGDGFSPMAYLVSKSDSNMVDDLIIDSKWCEIVSPKGFVYEGNFLNTGAPRCDVLYGKRTEYKMNFRKKHNLPQEAKVIMVAPTFRESAVNGKRSVYSKKWSIDFNRLVHVLETKFGGKWYICIRVHPQLAELFHGYKNPEIQDRLIDESNADDMYAILAGMDAYITDYSSACFEAAFAKIPVFIYADDIQKYAQDRGALMWNIADDSINHMKNNKVMTPQLDLQFPFTFSQNNDELENNITNFQEIKYGEQLDNLFAKMELVFEGNASKKVVDRLELLE